MMNMMKKLSENVDITVGELELLTSKVSTQNEKQFVNVASVRKEMLNFNENMETSVKTMDVKKAEKNDVKKIANEIKTNKLFVERSVADLLSQINNIFNQIESDKEDQRAKEAASTKIENITMQDLIKVERKCSNNLNNSMANVNYDIERHEKMILQKAEGSKLAEMIFRIDAMNPDAERAIERVQRQILSKASRSDMIRIASVANKLSTTVQVLHQAHLGEDQLSAASSRCLTCNRTVVSVAPKPAPVHKQQPAKLIPIGLRVHSRPRTASPASKRYGNNKNQQKIRVPYDTRDRNIQPSGSQDSLARQTSASSLNGETASYERMQPLFNYVKGCDGRLFRGSS